MLSGMQSHRKSLLPRHCTFWREHLQNNGGRCICRSHPVASITCASGIPNVTWKAVYLWASYSRSGVLGDYFLNRRLDQTSSNQSWSDDELQYKSFCALCCRGTGWQQHPQPARATPKPGRWLLLHFHAVHLSTSHLIYQFSFKIQY